MDETWWISEHNLDADQRQVVTLDLEKGFLVLGPPGSGKTNLLLLRAKYLCLAGHRDLQLLVFTRSLREFIAAGAARYEIEENRISTANKFWANILFQWDRPRPNFDSFSDQRRALVDNVAELSVQQDLSNLYHTILLDEAQDFLPEEAELFAKLGQFVFAVADERQKIYGGESPLSVLQSTVSKTIELKHHYRTGISICQLADSVNRNPERIADGSNYNESERPSSVRWHRCESMEEEVAQVMKILPDQLAAYPDELIGIISPSRAVVDYAWSALSSAGYGPISSKLQDGDRAFFPSQRICLSTLHNAKGLEYRALHVLGCQHFSRRPLPRSLAFTAATRAKTSLDMYYSDHLLGFLDQAIATQFPTSELPKVGDLF